MAGCRARVRWGWHCLSGPSCQSSLKTFMLEAGTTIHLALDLVMTLMFYFALTCEWCGDGEVGIHSVGRVPDQGHG